MQTVSTSQASDPPEDITVLDHRTGLVVRVHDNLTVENSAAFLGSTLSAWESAGNPPKIVVDMTGVARIDSSGAGALVALARKASQSAVPFILCGLGESPRASLRSTGEGQLFHTCATVEEALLGVAIDEIEGSAPVEPPAFTPRYPLLVPPAGTRGRRRSRTRRWFIYGLSLGLLALLAVWFWRNNSAGDANFVRTNFEAPLKQTREIAPGVSLEVNRVEVVNQRWAGHVYLMPDRATIVVPGFDVEKPLTFSTRDDPRQRRLVVTRVTDDSVAGYVLQPPRAQGQK